MRGSAADAAVGQSGQSAEVVLGYFGAHSPNEIAGLKFARLPVPAAAAAALGVPVKAQNWARSHYAVEGATHILQLLKLVLKITALLWGLNNCCPGNWSFRMSTCCGLVGPGSRGCRGIFLGFDSC